MASYTPSSSSSSKNMTGGAPASNALSSSSTYPEVSHAVPRSSELLSCARTALKIAQQRRNQRQQQQPHGEAAAVRRGVGGDDLPEWMADLSPSDLALYDPSFDRSRNDESSDGDGASAARSALTDASSLIDALDSSVRQMNGLVRRRGHTNDPTDEIQAVMDRFREYASELSGVIGAVRNSGGMPLSAEGGGARPRRSSGQRRRHYELVGAALESAASDRASSFKKALEVRSEVLRDQARRRKMLNPATAGAAAASAAGGKASSSSSSSSSFVAGGASKAMGVVPMAASVAVGVDKRGVAQLKSPLFTMTNGGGGSGGIPLTNLAPPPPVPAAASRTAVATSSSSAPSSGNHVGANPAKPAAPPYYASSAPPSGLKAYASGYGGASAVGGGATQPSSLSSGYGGGYGGYGGVGMRQRRQPQPQPSYGYRPEDEQRQDVAEEEEDDDTAEKARSQVQARRKRREARSRLDDARRAERTIAELGTMFTKMAGLVSQQGEVLERIEDDVEAAHGDIEAGHDEIVKLYTITKGNRGLILKVFGILIFFILFMRLY